MRIHTKTAAALAIISALSVAIPAEARPGRYRSGAGAYHGGGHGGYVYSRSSRYSGYSRNSGYGYGSYGYVSYPAYGSYGYAGYPAYSRYSGPTYYYGSSYGRGGDTALIIGAGLLGVALATALSSRSHRDRDSQDRGYHYDTGYGVTYDTGRQNGTNYDSARNYDNDRSGGVGDDDSVRNQDDDRDYVGSRDRDSDSDPYRYYRNGGRPGGDVEAGPVGM